MVGHTDRGPRVVWFLVLIAIGSLTWFFALIGLFYALGWVFK